MLEIWLEPLSEALFPIGVRSVDGYLMASPEKALCDYLYTRKDLRIYSPKTLASYLEEDVRFNHFTTFCAGDFRMSSEITHVSSL